MGTSQGGSADLFCLVALRGFKLEAVLVLLGVRNCDSETSLVGVPLDGAARDAGELRPLDLGVPRPCAFGRPAKDVAGRTLSRRV